MVVHADEKISQGAFELEHVVADVRDRNHTRRFVEGKHLERWLPRENRWLEWGTSRAPALFRRPTFPELYTVPEKIFIHRTAGEGLRSAYDTDETTCNHTVMVCLPWYSLHEVRNQSLKKAARYRGEKPSRPDLPMREELEATSRRFAVKYLLGVMNSGTARNFLRANRRSNTDLYPEDWKKLPVPDLPAAQQQPIVQVVDLILALKRHFQIHPGHRSARDTVHLDFLENLNDALVRELYTPDELHTHGLHFGFLVTEAHLPAVIAIRDSGHLEEVRQALDKASDVRTKLRAALFDLGSLTKTQQAAAKV